MKLKIMTSLVMPKGKLFHTVSMIHKKISVQFFWVLHGIRPLLLLIPLRPGGRPKGKTIIRMSKSCLYWLIRAVATAADHGCGNIKSKKIFVTGHGLSIRVSHYPPGSSKWNPIEHRLFSEVSKNWAGRPLESYETVLKYIRTTKTSTGLKVKAHFVRKNYKTGEKVSNKQMDQIAIKNGLLPEWNYILHPTKM